MIKKKSIIILLLLFGCGTTSRETKEKQRLANEVRNQAAIKIAKETYLVPYGTMGQMMYDIQKLGLAFLCYQDIELTHARELLVDAVDSMVGEINANEKIRPYLFNYPFKASNIEIRIFLRNPDGSDVSPGKLSVIEAIDGILEYRIDNSQTNLFTLIQAETYEEAKGKLEQSKRVL